jgi:stage V sporulation protein AF
MPTPTDKKKTKRRGYDRDPSGDDKNHSHKDRGDSKETSSIEEAGDSQPTVELDIPLSKSLSENKETMVELMGIGTTFDIVYREVVYGNKEMGMVYVNGFAKDETLIPIMNRLSLLEREQLVPSTLKHMFETFIPHIQVEKADNFKDIVAKVLSGSTIFFIDKENEALVVDAKSYPARSPAEPEVETVVRGSRDGFIETILANTALTRRRIRDQRLRIEMLKVGKRSQTDIAVAYLKDVADPSLLESIKDKIAAVDVDGLPMADKQVEELILKKGWNPYPLVRYTERPDIAAAHILEGHILVFVDTSPSAMILPTTFFHHLQHAEEYRQTPAVGIYLRWVRYFGVFASIGLLPLWMLFAMNPEMLPENLKFIGPSEKGTLPIFLQFLFAEIGIDLMRMAAIHTPTPLATAMGLVAAVLIGDIAVKVGLFIPEVILYLAIASVGSFATPSYELSLANRLARLVLLASTFLLGVPGFVGAMTIWVILLATTQSYKSPYLWPFIPFNGTALLNLIFRRPMYQMTIRPSITQPQQKRRQPDPSGT